MVNVTLISPAPRFSVLKGQVPNACIPIFIPDNAKEKPQRGTVISVGAGKRSDSGELIAPEVAVGEIVLYGKYSGTELSHEGKDYLIVRESDILAVL